MSPPGPRAAFDLRRGREGVRPGIALVGVLERHRRAACAGGDCLPRDAVVVRRPVAPVGVQVRREVHRRPGTSPTGDARGTSSRRRCACSTDCPPGRWRSPRSSERDRSRRSRRRHRRSRPRRPSRRRRRSHRLARAPRPVRAAAAARQQPHRARQDEFSQEDAPRQRNTLPGATRRSRGQCAKPHVGDMPTVSCISSASSASSALAAPHATRPEVLAPAGDADAMRAAVARRRRRGLLRARRVQRAPGRARRTSTPASSPRRCGFCTAAACAATSRSTRSCSTPSSRASKQQCAPAPRRRSTRSSCRTSAWRSSSAPSPPGMPIHASTQMTCTDAASVALARELRRRPRHPRAGALARGHRRDSRRDRRRARGLRARRAVHRVLGAVPDERGHRRAQRQPRRVRPGVPPPVRARRRRRLARARRSGVPALARRPRGERARAGSGPRSASSRSRSRDASRGPSTSRRRRRSTAARSTRSPRTGSAKGRPKKTARRRCRCSRAAPGRASCGASTTSASSTAAPAITGASSRAPREVCARSTESAASRSGPTSRSPAATASSSKASPRWAGGSGESSTAGSRSRGPLRDARSACGWGRTGASKRRTEPARRVWKTSDPARERQAMSAREARGECGSTCACGGRWASVPVFEATTERGARASVSGEVPLERARTSATTEEALREKLGRLGDTPFALGSLEVDLPEDVMLPIVDPEQRAPGAHRGARGLAAPARHHGANARRASGGGAGTLRRARRGFRVGGPCCARAARRSPLRPLPQPRAGPGRNRGGGRRRVPRLPRARRNRSGRPRAEGAIVAGAHHAGGAPHPQARGGEDRPLPRPARARRTPRPQPRQPVRRGARPRRVAGHPTDWRLLPQRDEPAHRGRGPRARACRVHSLLRSRRGAAHGVARPRARPVGRGGACITRCRSFTWNTA